MKLKSLVTKSFRTFSGASVRKINSVSVPVYLAATLLRTFPSKLIKYEGEELR